MTAWGVCHPSASCIDSHLHSQTFCVYQSTLVLSKRCMYTIFLWKSLAATYVATLATDARAHQCFSLTWYLYTTHPTHVARVRWMCVWCVVCLCVCFWSVDANRCALVWCDMPFWSNPQLQVSMIYYQLSKSSQHGRFFCFCCGTVCVVVFSTLSSAQHATKGGWCHAVAWQP